MNSENKNRFCQTEAVFLILIGVTLGGRLVIGAVMQFVLAGKISLVIGFGIENDEVAVNFADFTFHKISVTAIQNQKNAISQFFVENQIAREAERKIA